MLLNALFKLQDEEASQYSIEIENKSGKVYDSLFVEKELSSYRGFFELYKYLLPRHIHLNHRHVYKNIGKLGKEKYVLQIT